MNSQIQQKWSSQIMPQVTFISNGNIVQVALIIFQQETVTQLQNWLQKCIRLTIKDLDIFML